MDVRLVGASWGPTPAAASDLLVPPLMGLLEAPSEDTRRRTLALLNNCFGQMSCGFHDALPRYTQVRVVMMLTRHRGGGEARVLRCWNTPKPLHDATR
jgi:hypothetical protein